MDNLSTSVNNSTHSLEKSTHGDKRLGISIEQLFRIIWSLTCYYDSVHQKF